MTQPHLTHKLNAAQKMWDFGMTVTIAGQEYIQADKLYLRGTLEKSDGTVEARPLEYPSDRLSLINLISKMTEDEYICVIGTLGLNDNFKRLTPIMDQIFAAANIYREHSNKILYINEYLNNQDEIITLDKPVSIVLTPPGRGSELPFKLIAHGVFEFGANIEIIDTTYSFSMARQSDPALPKDARIYGSMHDIYGKVDLPKFAVKPKNQQQLEP